MRYVAKVVGGLTTVLVALSIGIFGGAGCVPGQERSAQADVADRVADTIEAEAGTRENLDSVWAENVVPVTTPILAATPPMGWNSWNLFACDIDEDLIRSMADTIVSSGMRDLGYEYVNLDDCWQVERDADGTIVPDPERFPSGIGVLADYMHTRGLKLGIYTCAGHFTCEGRPGSYGHEAQDMRTYAEWGVDLVKVDWCYTDGLDSRERYQLFHDGIAASGREMLLSICNWGYQAPWVWGPKLGQMWRTSMDIKDGLIPLMMNLQMTEPLAAFAGPGRWNDPDMLEVGNGGMSQALYQAHFGIWAMLAAPLITGNDLRSMDDTTRELLTNPEVIAVDQDPMGRAAPLLRVTDGVRVYARPLTGDGLRAVLFFNPSQQGHGRYRLHGTSWAWPRGRLRCGIF